MTGQKAKATKLASKVNDALVDLQRQLEEIRTSNKSGHLAGIVAQMRLDFMNEVLMKVYGL